MILPPPHQPHCWAFGLQRGMNHLLIPLLSFFIIFIVPIDLVFRIDSFLLTMSASDILFSTAALILVLACLSLLILLLESPLFLLLNRFSPKGAEVYAWLRINLLILAACMVFALTLRNWFMLAFGLLIPVRSVVLGLIFYSIILFRLRRGFIERFERAAATYRPILTTIIATSALLVMFRIVSTPGASQSPAPQSTTGVPDNVVLITFDALSAEDMSLYGYRLPTTPEIESFGKDATVFENCYANAPWTLPAVTSILTGKYPSSHQMYNWGNYNLSVNLNRQHENLPNLLRSKGYITAAFVNNLNYATPYQTNTFKDFDLKPLDAFNFKNVPPIEYFKLVRVALTPLMSRYRLQTHIWFNELFTEKLNEFSPILTKLHDPKENAYPPELVFNEAKNFLSKSVRPSFVWIHAMFPHEPYLAENPFRHRFLPSGEFDTVSRQKGMYGIYPEKSQPDIDRLRLRYNEMILQADAAFGDFASFLKSSGLSKNTILIVSADHGESFSNGFCGHSQRKMLEPIIRIPLLIHLPDQKSGSRVTGYVQQVDLAPTILELLNQKTPEWMDGKSLVPAIQGKYFLQKEVVCMDLYGNIPGTQLNKGKAALISNNYKYEFDYKNGNGMLYNIGGNKSGNHDISNKYPEIADDMKDKLWIKLTYDK